MLPSEVDVPNLNFPMEATLSFRNVLVCQSVGSTLLSHFELLKHQLVIL